MRLILAKRWAARQLCRIGLHRWGRVRAITDLDLRTASLVAEAVEIAFRVKGDRYAIQCERPGCRRTRST